MILTLQVHISNMINKRIILDDRHWFLFKWEMRIVPRKAGESQTKPGFAKSTLRWSLNSWAKGGQGMIMCWMEVAMKWKNIVKGKTMIVQRLSYATRKTNFKQTTIWLLQRFSNIQTHGEIYTNQSYISEVFKEFGKNASDNGKGVRLIGAFNGSWYA